MPSTSKMQRKEMHGRKTASLLEKKRRMHKRLSSTQRWTHERDQIEGMRGCFWVEQCQRQIVSRKVHTLSHGLCTCSSPRLELPTPRSLFGRCSHTGLSKTKSDLHGKDAFVERNVSIESHSQGTSGGVPVALGKSRGPLGESDPCEGALACKL